MTADLLYRNVFQLCDYEATKYDQSYILDTYKKDPDKGVAYALIKYDGIVYSIANKFYTLENEDKRSMVLEGIFKALNTYDENNEKKANFATHLTHVMINLFSNEIRKSQTQSRSLPEGATLDYLDEDNDSDDSASSVYNKLGERDYRLTDIEFLDCVKVLSLSDIEYRYLDLVMNDSQVPRDSEVCRELGIKRHTLTAFKKVLGKKLQKAITQ